MNGDLNSWDKFCNYLWFNKKLNIWLDISKINFTNEEIKILEEKFNFLILENDYLTTPERLVRLKEKIFKDQFFPIDSRDIKKIDNNE